MHLAVLKLLAVDRSHTVLHEVPPARNCACTSGFVTFYPNLLPALYGELDEDCVGPGAPVRPLPMLRSCLPFLLTQKASRMLSFSEKGPATNRNIPCPTPHRVTACSKLWLMHESQSENVSGVACAVPGPVYRGEPCLGPRPWVLSLCVL
jgi:hypothetical protein